MHNFNSFDFGFQDEESASKLPVGSIKEKFYRQLATTAESGWDFSTRWMRLFASSFTV